VPHGNNQTVADFERLGLSTSAEPVVSYAIADCPEPVIPGIPPFGPRCPTQRHVGTAEMNGQSPG